MTTSTPPIDTNALAFSYIRFSRKSQKLGRSSARQMEACIEWCKDNGVTLSDNTFLDDGKSGYTGEHVGPKGQLRRFLDLVEAGKIAKGSYLVIESLDRLGREDIDEALERFLSILNAGIRIVTLMDEKRVYAKPINMNDLLASVVVMERANNESKTKAKRSRDNWETAFDKARTEKRPVGKQVALWLKVVDLDELDEKRKPKREYRERPDRVKVVERIFRECIAGHGFIAIAKSLNADNVPAFRGGDWGASSVKEILDNRCVLGEWEPKDGKGVIEGYFPRIIDETTWGNAQVAMKARRHGDYTRQTANFQVWQQVAECATCGASMNLVKKGVHKYMACSTKRIGTCLSGNVRADSSEQVFKQILVKVGALGLIQSEAAAISDKIGAVAAEIVQHQKKLDEHTAAVATYGANPVFYKLIADTVAEIEKLEATKRELQEEHATQAAVQSDKAWLLDNLPLVERDDRQRANALLRRLDVKVKIRGGTDPVYVCTQHGKPFLQVMTVGEEFVLVPISAEQRERFAEQDQDGQDSAKLDDWLYATIGAYSPGAEKRATEKTEKIKNGNVLRRAIVTAD